MTIGEAVRVWRFGVIGNGLCSCGESFSTCSFWQNVADHAPGIFDRDTAEKYAAFSKSALLMSRRLPRLWTSRGRRRMVIDVPPRYLDDLSRFYRAVRAVSGAKVIVDASKSPAYRYLLGLVPELRVTTVQLVRDARAVAFSWQQRPSRSSSRRMDESLHMHQRRASVAGLDWILQNHSTDVLNTSVSSSAWRLHYEDFAANPSMITAEIVSIMGKPGIAQNHQVDQVVQLPEVHIFGNPSRFDTGKVPIRLDDEWRRAMPAASKLLVTAISSPVLLRYGYQLRSPHRLTTYDAEPKGQ